MPTINRTPRLRRSDCSRPGITRVRRGRAFSYVGEDGTRISDPETLGRLRALVIPPAWQEVWICLDPRGHLQATGIDAAGRKQYLYHERWRQQRDRQKFERMVQFAAALPRLRRRVSVDLRGEGPSRERVLACSVRMLDVGLFRIGSEEYAEPDGGLGLTTLSREHVTVRQDGTVEFDYPAKSGVRRRHTIDDPACAAIVTALKRRRGGPDELLAYRQGRRWIGLHADTINDYLKASLRGEFSAKDFRTWNATVIAAVALAADGREPATATGRRRVIADAVREVSELLGNTPAVARRAYIDPRVFDRYLSGWTIRSALSDPDGLGVAGQRTRTAIERAVVELLGPDVSTDRLVKLPKTPAGRARTAAHGKISGS
jgi:DNA topoisomerase-1